VLKPTLKSPGTWSVEWKFGAEGGESKPMATTLGEVLKTAFDLPWNHAVYLPNQTDWLGDTECIVHDPDDVEDDSAEEPLEARERNLKYVMDIASVRDILENLRGQGVQDDAAMALKAFCYYVEHDAFLPVVSD
jgi:hypothetical protein